MNLRMWLKEVREAASILQIDCAIAAGISREFYCMIENGKRRPSPEVAQKLGGFLGFDWGRFYQKDQQN